MSVTNNTGVSESLFLAKRSPSPLCRTITGLQAAAGFSNVNAVALDPIDDRIWLGGTNGEVGTIRVALISGNPVASDWQPYVGAPPGVPINGITFDNNGDPVVAAGTAGSGGIYRFHRCDTAFRELIGVAPSGRHNAISRDPDGNLYIGMSGGGIYVQHWQASTCLYNNPFYCGTVQDPRVTGLDWHPSDRMYITTSGSTGSAVFTMATSTGIVPPAFAGIDGRVAIAYDRAADDFWYCRDSGTSDTVDILTPSGISSPVCILPFGQLSEVSGVDVCNCIAGKTTVLPQCLGPNWARCLEFGTCGKPGDIASIWFVTPRPFPSPPQLDILISAKVLTANGRLSHKYPPLPPFGIPPCGTFKFASVTFDSSLMPTYGPVYSWPPCAN